MKKKHIFFAILICLIGISAGTMLLSMRNRGQSKKSDNQQESQTGEVILNSDPSDIKSIDVWINSGTAKGQKFHLSETEDPDSYEKIRELFFRDNVRYVSSKSGYGQKAYSVKVRFNEQNGEVTVFIYDTDTIRVDESDTFYRISQDIDNTIFKRMVEEKR